ncbi:MAG: NADH-quinone oxidoreductase subunit J [Chloroherpetonaceae bacterium]|nr:NADH-quinone oxidoreductase subunit J [Chloroherpetonaceae bacterium]
MQNFTYQAIFYLFFAIIVISASLVVFSRNIIYSAFSLLFTLFGVAAMYVFLSADFIAVTQVVVYVGGILVLLLFGVMLTNKITQDQLKTDVFNFVPGLIVMFSVLGVILYTFFFRVKWVESSTLLSGTVVEPLGYQFMTNYILPFEIVSIVLLVALLGAAYIARASHKELPEKAN